MGQRHQIFVIARIQGRYRCIAAFHSQWLYGQMVVKAAARLIKAFINPMNARAIASELASLDELDTEAIAHADNDDHENPAILCPYLTGLCLTCSRVDMEEGRLYKLSLEDVHFLPSQLDNDDGYTCFDVTTEGLPQYCFWWPGTGPLTAYEYLGDERDKQLDPSIYGILGHWPILGLDILAEVWPDDFRELLEQCQLDDGAPAQAPVPTLFPNSPAFVRSAASAVQAIKGTSSDPSSEVVRSELDGLAMIAFVNLGRDNISRLLGRARDALSSDAASQPRASADTVPSADTVCASADTVPSALPPPESLSQVNLALRIGSALRASNPNLDSQGVSSVFGSLFAKPDHLRVLREELLAAKTLNPNDILRLKQLITEEKDKFVDLKPWTGTLDAATLLDFSDALRAVECLDLSFSSTLTAEILEALVPRLPNIRHIIAFGCKSLGPLTTALPLTSYLASLPVLDAIDQSRVKERYAVSMPECLRWVEESDPPAGLTIVMHSPSLTVWSYSPTPKRYGLELSHFGAEGVVRGLSRYLERLYQEDYSASESGCYFEFRAYFHSTGSNPVRECTPASVNSSASYSFGCLPSLIRDVSPDDGHAYPAMERTTASGAVTSVPRHPGWVLTLDTKGTMPYHRNLQTVDIRSLFDINALIRRFFSTSRTSTSAVPGLSGNTHNSTSQSLQVAEDASPRSPYVRPDPKDASADTPQESEDDAPTPRQNAASLPALDDTSAQPPNDAPSRAPNDAPVPPPWAKNAPQPEYAFERWDLVPVRDSETKKLQVVERLSVREWVGRLPAGHGPVPEALLADCEAVLARLNVALRASPEETVAAN
ncbi:hypothetical protein AURDEDRAFT_188646 [Auricularia subglabra TFB-10046 SS5]|nr:hypothetical protein AURDEDRAFT_188646 [Auricularia subglabra TFB-10046 SS5]